MCGINGIFAYHTSAEPVAPDELNRTRDSMRLRGPDGAGMWISRNGRIGFGHRRLAIIDLSDRGAQPMASEDGRLHVVFNGEIYNYRELRKKLESQGTAFCSHSDTEVLLHLYRRNGPEMVRLLRGMFAFAIWDETDQILFLARDPYGIKPLYYSDDGRTFRFASQVKALQAGGGVSHELDPAGVVGFLLWGSVPEPFTLYKAIRLLQAGHSLKVTPSGTGSPEAYWDLAEVIERSCVSAEKVSHGQEREYVRHALLDSVTAHMVADVPVGAFLSAGLDSTTVVGLAREVSSNDLQTITLSFEEFKGKPIDELPMASRIAQCLGVQHQCVTASMQEVENDIPRFLTAMDQPTIDGINTWFVSKAAAQAGLKVALSGLGGDELLGGYASFKDIPLRVRSFAWLSRIALLGELFRIGYGLLANHFVALKPQNAGLLKYGGTYEGAYRLQRGIFMPWQLGQIMNADCAREGFLRLQAHEREEQPGPALNAFGRVVFLESSRYMRNQLLRDTDWAGMAHSLEIRVPLVDSVLTEKIVGLAATGRLGAGKAILPSSLCRQLPQEVLVRPKTGFTVPIWKWLRKSSVFDAWKRIKLLRNPNMHDYTRWAYFLMSTIPEAHGVLK